MFSVHYKVDRSTMSDGLFTGNPRKTPHYEDHNQTFAHSPERWGGLNIKNQLAEKHHVHRDKITICQFFREIQLSESIIPIPRF